MAGTLFLVFLHGFKGNDKTFEDFPQRLAYSLSHTFASQFPVESIVYPSYKTCGKLEDAVMNFLSWLQGFVAEQENQWLEAQNTQREREGQTKLTWSERDQARVILLGHSQVCAAIPGGRLTAFFSMGGLVAADVALALLEAHTKTDAQLPLWPKLKAVIAFDTPYLGLNPATFQNTADQYIKHATDAHDLFSTITGVSVASLWGAKAASSSSKQKQPPAQQSVEASPEASGSVSNPWLNVKTAAAAVGGTAVAAGLAGLAWNKRQALSSVGANSWDFVNSHFEFVGALFQPKQLEARLSATVEAGDQSKGAHRVRFHCFYTIIPTSDKRAPKRTFINLPKDKTPQRKCFTANANDGAAHEIDAHTTMFGTANPGSHQLVLETVRLISAWAS